MKKTLRRALICLPLLVLPAMPVKAEAPYDDMIMGALRCTRYFSQMEREYQLPPHLLSAISVTETGRYHKKLGVRVPWPWTINAEGKGDYFRTKNDALQTVRKLQKQGMKSIDVGCMQVNLYHHADAFPNLATALDPRSNIRYAIEFLLKNYERTGSWQTAIAHYHSKTPSRGRRYAEKVINTWREHIRIANLYGDRRSGRQLAAASPKYKESRLRSDMMIHVADTQETPDGVAVTRIRRLEGGEAQDRLGAGGQEIRHEAGAKIVRLSQGNQ